MMHPDPIVLVSAADDNYAMPLATMLKSALGNRPPERAVCCFVLNCGMTDQNMRRVEESFRPESPEIHWVSVQETELRGLPAWGGMSLTTYHRLWMPRFLSRSIAKACWLDADMLVLGDISKLWDEPMGDNALLAAQDLVVPYVSSTYGVSRYRQLGLPRDAKYFNAGVMVVNLEWWRRNDVTSQVLGYLRENRREVWLYDQDGLNAVLSGRWGEVNPRWNQIASVAGRPFFKARHLQAEQYRLVVEEPWIVHYAGAWKPWNHFSRSPLREQYFRYLDRTVWAGWRPDRSLGLVVRSLYSSLLRDVLYPLERLRMEWLRRIG